MFQKLNQVEKRYKEITQRLYDPAVVSDVEQYRRLMKESKNLEPIVEAFREYNRTQQHIEEARSLLEAGGLDREMRELAELELAEGREKKDGIRQNKISSKE